MPSSSCFKAALAAVVLTFTAVAAQDTKAADSAYLGLVNKVNAGDLSVDFRALRLACANASRCDAHGGSEDIIAMRRAAQNRKYEQAVRIAQKLITEGFPNIEAHAVLAQAYAALEKPDKANFHRAVTSALIRSILSTGDGKAKETAFEVIGTQEEHIILSVLGLPPFGSQAVMPGKPHSYDVIEVENPKNGEKVAVYFLIDAFYPMKGL